MGCWFAPYALGLRGVSEPALPDETHSLACNVPERNFGEHGCVETRLCGNLTSQYPPSAPEVERGFGKYYSIWRAAEPARLAAT